MTIEHVDAPLGEIHIPHNWEFADAAARTAANITDALLVKRLALQLDDTSFWLLIGVSPVVWAPVGGGGSGTPGAPGADGKSVLNGATAPSSGLGTNGDFYINTATWSIYGPKASGAWGSGTPLVGPQGVQGNPGTAGVDGRTVLSGTVAPSSGTGANGDFYINTTTWDIYGPKASGAWGSSTPLVGPQGAQGVQGVQGPQGAQGAPGSGGSLTIKDEGTTLTATPGSINFTGAGITATESGGAVTVDVPAASKASVGLGNVDNTSDANKPVSTAQAASIATKEPVFSSGTTSQWLRGDKTFQALVKGDVGLGNVDNTSDANKPVSTAQATADTATLNSAKAYADSLVVGLWDDRGNYNASVNTFPASGGSGSAGAVLKGDIWTITVAGTLGGVAVSTGQTVRATVDAPAQTAGNWAISVAGTANIDDSITDNVTGRAPSQNAVFDALALKENAITAGTTAQYLRGDKTLSDFMADVRAATLTGLSTATNAAIVAADTVLGALGKLQKQITDLIASKDATGGIVGMTLFKINFKNAANTFTSFFTNTNTAARTYTFPDKDITVAGLSDTISPAAANTFTDTQTFNGSATTFGMKILSAAEKSNIVAAAANGTMTIFIGTTGHLTHYTTAASANFALNFGFVSGNSINNAMAVGDVVTATVKVTQGATPFTMTSMLIESAAQTVKWLNGSANVIGTASSQDVYTFVITKTGASTYDVLGSQSMYK